MDICPETRAVIIKGKDLLDPPAIANLDPFQAEDTILYEIGEFKRAKPTISGVLLVEVNELKQVLHLINLETFCGYNVEVK